MTGAAPEPELVALPLTLHQVHQCISAVSDVTSPGASPCPDLSVAFLIFETISNCVQRCFQCLIYLQIPPTGDASA